MSRVTIRNFGPIKDVTLELNKVNVIIGMQSSGKSTIAKIISYCQWVEKRYLLDGDFKYKFADQFMNFHRISEVSVDAESLIYYESESVQITYLGPLFELAITKIKEGVDFLKTKNIYIPAERNFVSVIPNLAKFKSSDDNIMNFLYDWYEVKKNYVPENMFSILDLGISYYHIQESDSDKLFLDKSSKELSLNNASSGLQSVIPLLLLIDYLAVGLYKEKSIDSILEKEQLIKWLLEFFNQEVASDKEKVKMLSDIGAIANGEFVPDALYALFLQFRKRSQYQYSQFIIEEPEQNLFPETQRDLVYHILKLINTQERNHKLLLTTHSPYILYALNNCMMGFLVKDKMTNNDKSNLHCSQSWIDPLLVSIWEIEDGSIRSIQGEDGLIGSNYFDAAMKSVMDDFYVMLNYYGNEE